MIRHAAGPGEHAHLCHSCGEASEYCSAHCLALTKAAIRSLHSYVKVRQSLEQFASTSGGAGSKPDVLQEHVVVRLHPAFVGIFSCRGRLLKALCWVCMHAARKVC